MGSVRVASAMLLAILLLSGCGRQLAEMRGIPIVSPLDPAAVHQHTTVDKDEAVGIIQVAGPMIFARGNVLSDIYLVRAFLPIDQPQSEAVYQVYVEVPAKEWLLLGQAYSEGKEFTTKVLDREAERCSDGSKRVCYRTEKIGVAVTHDDLKRFAETGFDFKVLGRRDSRSFSIPAGYFKGFLLRLDELKASRAA